MGIKSKKSKPKINKNRPVEDCSSKPISFSFKYLTSDKRYNFENMVKADKKAWQSALMERIIELSGLTWLDCQNFRKNQGYETIPAGQGQLNFSPKNYILTDDEKAIVFRFNSQKGRIIGVKDSCCSLFYVIGLDTDFSAYNHGN